MSEEVIKRVWPEWTLERELGAGSYGRVYKAVRGNDMLSSSAAIKVISVPRDQSEVNSVRAQGFSEEETKNYFEEIVKGFVSEIQLMDSLKGTQNIVSVEDYQVVERTNEIGWDILIRMELLTPFTMYIQQHQMSEKEVLKLGTDICSALELCEQQQIIHRDIKWENLFVNHYGHFKLGDFGIARKLENAGGGLSQKGTYTYMAPEVAQGNNYDTRVDLYSLGLVLYRSLNRNFPPFIATKEQLLNPNTRDAAVNRRMRGEALPPPCEASAQTAAVILQACAFRPDDRFSTARAMKAALEYAKQFSNDRPVATGDPGTAGSTVLSNSQAQAMQTNASTGTKEPITVGGTATGSAQIGSSSADYLEVTQRVRSGERREDGTILITNTAAAQSQPEAPVVPGWQQIKSFLNPETGGSSRTGGTVPPVTDGTVPPVTGGTVPPVTGGTVPPVTGGTVPPVTGGTVPPVTGGTVPPVTGGTIPPVTGGTVPPVTGGTVPPVTGGTVPPVTGGTIPPVIGGTVPPVTGGTVPPVTGGTVPPVTGGTVPSMNDGPAKPVNMMYIVSVILGALGLPFTEEAPGLAIVLGAFALILALVGKHKALKTGLGKVGMGICGIILGTFSLSDGLGYAYAEGASVDFYGRYSNEVFSKGDAWIGIGIGAVVLILFLVMGKKVKEN